MTPDQQPAETAPSRRGRLLARWAGVAVVVAIVVSFVVQNDQPVVLRLWTFTGHPRLIWVLVVALVVGLVLGFLAGRALRRRRRRGAEGPERAERR